MRCLAGICGGGAGDGAQARQGRPGASATRALAAAPGGRTPTGSPLRSSARPGGFSPTLLPGLGQPTWRALVEPSAFELAPDRNAGSDAAVPLFVGRWPGTRNDWAGDVGISFTLKASGVIAAVGRHISDGAHLAETVAVTLWSTDTMKALASVQVGPSSAVEGHYAFEVLDPPVAVHSGQEYRLSQRCTSNMRDRWFDGKATPEEVTARCASQYAEFLGGVCRNEPGYPKRDDGAYRRAGMVNFKFARQGMDVMGVTREEFAHALASIAAVEEPGQPEATGAYVAVIATLLALFVDQLQDLTCPAAFVAIAPESELRNLLRRRGVDGGAASPCDFVSANTEAARTVFHTHFAEELVAFSRRHAGKTDEAGRPVECGLLMCHQSGVVLAAATQVACGSRGAMTASGVAGVLRKGMVLTRSERGAVTAYPSSEVRQGRALQIESGLHPSMPVASRAELRPMSREVASPAAKAARADGAPGEGASPAGRPADLTEAIDEREAPPNGKLLDESAVNSSWLGCSPHGVNDVLKWDWLAGFKAP